MKKLFLLLFIISFIFSGCKKDNDYVFNQSPDERINAAISSYQSKLLSAENGWKALITVNNGTGGTYSFYFKFNNENRVKMFSDFDSSSAVTPQESSYRLKAQQQPTLIFDTYSYVHILADPNEGNVVVQADVNGGPVGQGLLSDFEFILDEAKIKADTMELTGKVNHSKLILVKATKAEEDGYNRGELLRGLSINKILTYFKRLSIGTLLFDVQINVINRTLTFTWVDGTGAAKTFTTNYFLTVEGISLTNPLQTGTQTISAFTAMNFNTASQIIDLKVNNVAATISSIVVPLAVDVNAPIRWFNQAAATDDYWVSFNGFHVNGVDDAYKVNSLTGNNFPYLFYIYYPKFGSSNDFFGPIFINTAAGSAELIYGTAPRTPTFTTDGRAVFTELGTYPPYPTAGPAVLTRSNLYGGRGFYFVQTGANSYDMVSATDGKSWINWEK